MRRIRVGVIGCGEAAQLLHLPALVQLSDRFQVTALCDVSPTVLNGVGDVWGVDRRLADHRALAELPGSTRS
jgi:predicted dehydrogenase